MNFRLLKIIYANFLLLFIFTVPVLVLAQSGGGTGGGTGGVTKSGITYDCAPKAAVDSAGNPINNSDGSPMMIYGECGFQDLVDATLHAVNYASAIAIAFTTVVIVYAGFNYMASGSNPGKRKEANGMLTKAVIGIALIVGAWLIVQFVVSALGADTGPIKFNP